MSERTKVIAGYNILVCSDSPYVYPVNLHSPI